MNLGLIILRNYSDRNLFQPLYLGKLNRGNLNKLISESHLKKKQGWLTKVELMASC